MQSFSSRLVSGRTSGKIVNTHAVIGAKLLGGDDSNLMRMVRDIALTHHEK
jgi:putative two-component system response regulator